MTDDAQRWKSKYLQSLEQQEQLERRWEARLDLLRRGLVRSSLAAEGSDKAVDQCMQELRDILRRDMGFGGIVFSDDIGMAAAESAGGVKARIDAHLDAGCDVVLVCAPALVPDSLKAVDDRAAPAPEALASLFGRAHTDWHALAADARYDGAREALRRFEQGVA